MGVYKIDVEVSLTEVNCGKCGGVYAINERLRQQREEEGGGWYCPYCRVGWGYFNDNENARLKKELEQQKKRIEWARNAERIAKERAEEAERRRVAQKAATTRLRNRAKAGICPCCSRYFKQLKAHMDRQHPDFKAEPDEDKDA